MFYYKRKKKEAYVLLGDKCRPTPNPKIKKEITTMNICHKYQGKHQSIYFILVYTTHKKVLKK